MSKATAVISIESWKG